MLHTKKSTALIIVALGTGVSGAAVVSATESRAPGVPINAEPAPAPGETSSAGRIGALSVPAPVDLVPAEQRERVDRDRTLLGSHLGGPEALPNAKQLARPEQGSEVWAFWGMRAVCLRVRPAGAPGGSGFCATPDTAANPATPMYEAPEAGGDGLVTMLVPDEIETVTVTTRAGERIPLAIAENVASGSVTDFGALTWALRSGKTYSRSAGRGR